MKHGEANKMTKRGQRNIQERDNQRGTRESERRVYRNIQARLKGLVRYAQNRH
ncbi:MAG: hypothetical protein LBU27_09225 [Candidatus Peribacteria bacterium]|nr:hypothetical protein [Candidatus Peribacteria bacterium]